VNEYSDKVVLVDNDAAVEELERAVADLENDEDGTFKLL